MKKVLTTILTAGLAFAMISTSGTAYAEDFKESDTIQQSENSKATVTFKAPTKPVEPVNPRDPKSTEEYTLDEEDGKVTGKKGPLSLDVVPHFNFGETTIDSKEANLFATNKQPYIQISDFRGPKGGWHVEAKLSKFNLTGDSAKSTLPGASITLKAGEAASTVNENLPTPSVLNDKDEKITLMSGDTAATNIVSANGKSEQEKAQGLGTWIVRWLGDENENYNQNVKLTVPAFEASPGTHEATIDWTLSDGPAIEPSDIKE